MKLWGVYKSLKPNLAHDVPQEIENLILIYQMVALKNKINRLMYRKTKYQEKIYMNYQKIFILTSESNIFKYNFC